jgi:hypothetical protein
MMPISTVTAIATTTSMAAESVNMGRINDSHIEAWNQAGVEDNIQKMFAELESKLLQTSA